MRIRTPRSAIAALSVALLLATIPAELEANDRALVTRLVGLARVQKGGTGPWKPLKVKDIVNSNDRLQTGPQSQLILLHKGIEIRLIEKTEVTVSDIQGNQKPLQVKLERGFTWLKVENAKDKGVVVTSPTAVASVRGTAFSVSHDHNGTATCVCKGRIMTRAVDGGDESTVAQGFSNDYTADGELVQNDFREMFRGLKVDFSFKEVIEKDPKMKDCTSCHKMTDLATDNTPDPLTY